MSPLERILLAKKYKWRGGNNACYKIQDEKGTVLFSLWSQFHAVVVLNLCKRIQKLSLKNPEVER